MRVRMRDRLFPAVAVALATAAFARAGMAAEGDDLPAGNDAPRLVPIAIIDAYWAYHDTPPVSRQATLMTTAIRHDEFQINLAAIGMRLEHAKLLGTVILQAGTSVDALYPPAAGSAQNNPEVWKHIQVASVGYRVHPDVTVEAGVMPSHFGNEGFVSTTNWNYTRAMIAEATPYFISGVKVAWRPAPAWTLTGLVYNGWDVYSDLGRSKSGGARIDFKPSDRFTIYTSGHVGPGAEGTHAVRIYDDTTAKLNLHARVDVALQLSFGMDKTQGLPSKNVYGAAAWLRWMLGDSTYVAIRGEYLADDRGLFTGQGARPTPPLVAGSTGITAPLGQKMLAGTFTLGWFLHPSLLARAEVMQRTADVEYFAGGSPQGTTDRLDGAQKRSTTVAGSLAFTY